MVSQEEFNDLIVKYRNYIYGQVIRNGGGDESEDFVQECILHACRLRLNFDPDKGSFVTWMKWKIRSCMQQIRVKRRNRRHINNSVKYSEEGALLTDAVAVDNPHYSLELRETLDAVFELEPKRAHAVVQRALGDSFDEIGQDNGYSAQRAQVLHMEGVIALRKKLDQRRVYA